MVGLWRRLLKKHIVLGVVSMGVPYEWRLLFITGGPVMKSYFYGWVLGRG